MATLPGQRAQFTWALNQYNQAEDQDTHTKFARRMAKYISAAPANGFTIEQVTQGKSYPIDEVKRYLNDPSVDEEPDISEEQAAKLLERAVNTKSVIRIGEGKGVVYAYGYRCAPDRMKIGYTEGETTQRIAAQISTSTPDRPVLYMEIRTDAFRALERAIHGILEVRGRKIEGAGAEWFRVMPQDILSIYKFIFESTTAQGSNGILMMTLSENETDSR